MGASLRQHPGKSRSLILRVRCTAGWSAVTSHVDGSKAVKRQDPRAVLCGCRGLAEGRSAAWTLGEMCGAPLPRLELLADLGPYSVPPGPTGRPGWCDQAPAQAPHKGVRAGSYPDTWNQTDGPPGRGKCLSTLSRPLTLGPQELRLPPAWTAWPRSSHPSQRGLFSPGPRPPSLVLGPAFLVLGCIRL